MKLSVVLKKKKLKEKIVKIVSSSCHWLFMVHLVEVLEMELWTGVEIGFRNVCLIGKKKCFRVNKCKNLNYVWNKNINMDFILFILKFNVGMLI